MTRFNLKYLTLQSINEGQAGYAHVNEIIKGLKEIGWNVDLYAPAYRKDKAKPTIIERIFEFLRVQIKCLASLKICDVLYVRGHYVTFLAVITAKLRKIPVVFELNGPYDDLFIAWPLTRYFQFFFKWIMKTQLKFSDAIVTVTPQLKDWLVSELGKEYDEKIYVIPNGANVDLFSPNNKENLALEQPYVVFFGALTKWQGIDFMINAVKDEEWPQELRLVIVGDGAEKEKIERFASKNNRVIYLGPLPYKDIPAIVSNSIASLSCKVLDERSFKGLSPLKVYESLACGVPVIVTDYPYISDLVKENNCGIVVPPNDVKALVNAVNFLLKNERERKQMGKIGRQLVVRYHSWKNRAEETDKVLRKVLKCK